MPIVAQDGTVVLDAYFRNAGGSPVDGSSVSVTVRDLSQNIVEGPAVEPQVLHPALGYYTYEWDTSDPVTLPLGTYAVTWYGIYLGEDLYGYDTVEIVQPGSIITGPLEFLKDPDDYHAIRELLGLQASELDLGDEVIERLPFGPQAERMIKEVVSNWSTQIQDADKLDVLRTAAIYGTAALICEAWTTGGTIGLVRPREERDWAMISQQLWGRFHRWVQTADAEDDDQSTYALSAFQISGPTRALPPNKNWWDTMPVYGVDVPE